jgi:large subunit ribosomal protein L24
MKIKKGDKVIVISGKYKGKTGPVLRAIPLDDKIVIEGINVVKRHKKNRASGAKGEIIEISMPIHVSNVMLEDPKTSKPTRIGYKTDDKGKKVRFAKKSGEVIK